MTTTLRPAAERGQARLDWLTSFHSFSFADYYDPRHMGVSNLRVINDDRIAPGGGFATHGHQDMEIVTYVLDGALEHKDSLGNGSVIRPGDVQYMSAGTGVRHSEHNASRSEPVHLLQIWLLPNRTGVAPRYDQRHFPVAARRGRLALAVSPDGREGSIATRQDGLVYATLLAPGECVSQVLAAPGDGNGAGRRQAYVHVARGRARAIGEDLGPGDAIHIRDAGEVRLAGAGADAGDLAEILLFDLP